ncbi:MAG: Gfo/Idh/MocA family oxidoreductase [Candidatus Latescibacteria bacterium]|nr:Gfo/Idh/MocA family oxidoreductase [Candidatus Latescibacterota bacterium]
MPVNAFDLNIEYLPKLPQKKDYGIGCIGSGFIMRDCHLVAYHKAGFKPVAIASKNRAHAEETARLRNVKKVYDTYHELLDDPEVEVVDIAVPPNRQVEIVREVVKHNDHVKAVLAQKPNGSHLQDAQEVVRLCDDAGIKLAVNQNMRYDHSIRALKWLLDRGYLGEPILATVDMRAIPHWMPWQEEQGWCTCRIMSIHHLDCFRFLFGDPERVFASFRPDPRTRFPHEDGICLYIIEYENGLRASSWDDVWTGPAREGAEKDIAIRWRVEGTEGMARGTIGWPDYPWGSPSTIDFTTAKQPGYWFQPRWPQMWFPDAFAGTMAQLLRALEDDSEPEIGGRDNLKTMALVDAAYLSAKEHRAVSISELLP